MAEIQKLEKEVQGLKATSKAPPMSSDGLCTAVFGGLSSFADKEVATRWLQEKMAALGGSVPVDTYIKGDFKGVLFAKFASSGARDLAVDVLRKVGCKEGGHDVWGKPDLPLPLRVQSSFAFGLKYILAQWGFDSTSPVP